jgi:hypothetical protein
MGNKVSKLSRFFGFSQIRQSYANTSNLIKQTAYKTDDVKEETFSEACIRYGIKGDSDTVNKQLESIYNNLRFGFYTKISFSFFAFIIMLYNLFVQHYIISVIISLLLMVAFLIYSAFNSLRCFQINKRELGLLKEWLLNPANWFPTKFKHKNWVPDDKSNEVTNVSE